MNYLRETFVASASKGPQHVPSSAVQLEMEMVPDSEEDCKMKDNDSVELITMQDFDVVKQSTTPKSDTLAELKEGDKKPDEKCKDERRGSEEPLSCSKENGKREEGEEAKPALHEILGNQLVSHTRKDSWSMAENRGYNEYSDSLQECISNQNGIISRLSEKIHMLEAEITSGRKGFWAQKVQDLKGRIHDLRKIVSTQETRLSDLFKENQFLKAQNTHIQQKYAELTASYETVQTRLRQRDTDPGEPPVLAIGTKVSDGELKSQWTQLQFTVRNLALLIDDNLPEDRCPPLGKGFQRHSGGNKSKSSRNMFKDLDLRRWAIEQYLWSSVYKIVFESQSKSDWDKTGHNLKQFKKFMLDKLNAHQSTQLGSYCKWFNDGWKMTKPSEGAIETMLQNDCGGIYELVYGAKQLKDGADELGIQDELREIFSLAMEFDDMRMQSRAIITFHWPDLTPKKKGSSHAGYQDATMNAVNMDQKPPEHARIQLIVSPALLKRGTANGRNYDSEMVLVKANVLVYSEEDLN
ncbi:hypothetical protein E4U55_002577 [Claviceps digitariae]|nr:hypothetical protein E4U55_002577 [Claviceps digitariae]